MPEGKHKGPCGPACLTTEATGPDERAIQAFCAAVGQSKDAHGSRRAARHLGLDRILAVDPSHTLAMVKAPPTWPRHVLLGLERVLEAAKALGYRERDSEEQEVDEEGESYPKHPANHMHWELRLPKDPDYPVVVAEIGAPYGVLVAPRIRDDWDDDLRSTAQRLLEELKGHEAALPEAARVQLERLRLRVGELVKLEA